MSSWIDYAKQLLAYYLGTQDDNYLVTEDGLLLWIVDHEFSPLQKIVSSWTGTHKN